ncbi:MAG: hypothetical protein GY928_07900 [Colwellia sp.]|nr:hypothetical protein [Colwellia sp.]
MPVESVVTNALSVHVSGKVKQGRIDREYFILVDEVNDLSIVVRSYMDAPEVDGKVYLSDYVDAKPGDQLWEIIIHEDEHDVWGVRVED